MCDGKRSGVPTPPPRALSFSVSFPEPGAWGVTHPFLLFPSFSAASRTGSSLLLTTLCAGSSFSPPFAGSFVNFSAAGGWQAGEVVKRPTGGGSLSAPRGPGEIRGSFQLRVQAPGDAGLGSSPKLGARRQLGALARSPSDKLLLSSCGAALSCRAPGGQTCWVFPSNPPK